MVRTSRKIPNGYVKRRQFFVYNFSWESYEPIGVVIEGTRIFAFKTPLYCELQKHVANKSKRFTTSMLFRKVCCIVHILTL